MAIVTVGFNPAIDRVLECPDFHIGGHQAARQIARLAAGKAGKTPEKLGGPAAWQPAATIEGLEAQAAEAQKKQDEARRAKEAAKQAQDKAAPQAK